ncbi:MAG: TRAP transporter substrate-binding protein [Deltaproteobacteria bacterium]|nr:TRAP transporter substrate-binding protein [Deltaproteobacteria bacterium]MBW2307201.1 TRAP transporter substrate-binding protein [Deltaproteobacteria bacterium]
MALGDAPGGTQWALGERFAKLMNAYTKGEVVIHLFPTGQLGSEQETVQNCRLGTLDFSIVAINNITPFSPTVGLFTLPYMILSVDDAVKLTQGPIGEELNQNTIRDAGVRLVGWSYSGFRVMSNSKRPVKTLKDLKGLTIRVPKNAIMIDTYKSWGVNPTPMAWDEVFTALQQGVIDGQDTPIITQYVMKFYEVQKYITSIRYVFLLEPLIISEALFQRQTPDMQKLILRVGKEAQEYCRQFLILKEDEFKKSMREKGMQIMDPADNEREWIEKATAAVWPKYYKSIGGKEKVDKAMEFMGRK